MLSPNTPPDNNPNHSLMEIVPFLEELEAEQLKILGRIVNNDQRIAALEAALGQVQYSLAENLSIALGTLKESIEMARSVLAAEHLSDAHASAARYLASRGISSEDSSSVIVDECVKNTHA